MQNQKSPAIILSHPQMGENIGAAARAMQNFSLSDLRLVKPRDGWPNTDAKRMASGAFEHMPPPRVFENLADAIADLHTVYATTARKHDQVKNIHSPQSAARDAYKKSRQDQSVGFLFGAERTGLRSEEISLCQAMITIPTNPGFSSLNLGQSVLLIAYEWMKNSEKTASPTFQNGESPRAKQGTIQNFLNRLITDLDDRHFFRSEGLKPTMVKNIINIFTRTDLTEQEVSTLQGILSALRGNKKQPK